MIIVKVKAGLGNQMFQYACGRALVLRNHDSLKLDLSEWSLQRETSRKYELDRFDIVADVANENEIRKLKYPYGRFLTRVLNKIRTKMKIDNISFNPSITQKKGSMYLDGYWQSEKYFSDFADQIRKDFRPKDPLKHRASELLDKIKSDDRAVSVHIRRGDNAHSPSSLKSFGCPGIEYYEAAMTQISKILSSRINLYVFSDDIDWAKRNLHTRFPITFVSDPDIETYEEIVLMSNCRHNIISNSTFGWWGAWLNTNNNKTVVAPKQWALKRLNNFKDIIPPRWIRI